jgi:hypothetical protein
MSVSPYGRHDVAVCGGITSSQVTNPKRVAEIERDAAELVRLQQEARARLLGEKPDTLKREQHTKEDRR